MSESQMSCPPKDWQFYKVSVIVQRQFAEIVWVDAYTAHIEEAVVGTHSASQP